MDHPVEGWTPTKDVDWRGQQEHRAARHPWTRDADRSANGLGRARRRRPVGTVFASVLFLTALAAFLWVSSWLAPPPPASLVLVGANYRTNLDLPLNLDGWKSLETLAKRATSPKRGLLRLSEPPLLWRQGMAWDKGIDEQPNHVLIVCLAMHGATDTAGPYLIPDDYAVAEAGDGRLRFAQILERLERLPRNRPKVLLLDPMILVSSWPLGVLSNQFVRGVEEFNERIAAIDNLVVILSASADQRSWNSPELGQSMFFHFVTEALAGAGDTDRDGLVDVGELLAYTRERVGDWAKLNRFAIQTPMLLPLGEMGAERAERIVVAYADHRSQGQSLADVPALDPPESLREIWQTYTDLSQRNPPPNAVAPLAWRRYEKMLVRYEQLVRQGDPATDIASVIAGLERTLASVGQVNLTSASNSLAMVSPANPTQSSQVPQNSQASSLDSAIHQLWEAKADKQAGLWAKLLATATGAEAQLSLRIRTYQSLLQQFSQNPSAGFSNILHLIQTVRDPLRPLPAEVEWVRMLGLYYTADPMQTASLLQQSIQVRLLAEQAALGTSSGPVETAGRVAEWVQPLIDAADAERRMGEDLLLVGDTESLAKAATHLSRANTIYQQAITDGQAIRTACLQIDAVCSQGAYLALLMAELTYPTDPNRLASAEARMKDLVEMWNQMHALEEMISKVQPLAPPAEGARAGPSAVVVPIVDASDTVAQRIEELNQAFRDAWADCLASDLALVIPAIDLILSVPFPDPDWRFELAKHASIVARRTLVQPADSSADLTAALAAGSVHREQWSARRQGTAALAVLGTRSFQQLAAGSTESFAEVNHRLEVLLSDPKWWLSIEQAGDEIGKRFRLVSPQILAWTAPIQTSQSPSILQAVADAAQLSRIQLWPTVDDTRSEPATMLQSLLLSRMLTWQANRTWFDHWAGENPAADPYYRLIGGIYLADSSTLALAPYLRDAVTKERQRLDQPGWLEMDGPDQDVRSTERMFDQSYRLAIPAGSAVPPGVAAVWVKTDGPLEILSPTPKVRLGRPFDDQHPPVAVDVSLSSPLIADSADANADLQRGLPPVPSVTQATVTAVGLFRGHLSERRTQVAIDPVPNVQWIAFEPPRLGSVAMSASAAVQQQLGAGSGALAIVLDASGSMGPPAGQTFGPKTKYHEALAALEAVLGEVPQGTQVSVWIFGEAVGSEKSVAVPETTIRRVIPPTPLVANTPEARTAFLQSLQYPHVEPWNESPIVRAMVSAKADLDAAVGTKTLLVLTDGMDNRLEQDKELNPKGLQVAQFLRQTFAPTDIVVNVIGFKVTQAEQLAAEAQFQVVREFPNPGVWTTTEDSAELAKLLSGVFRPQLRYWIEEEDTAPASGVPLAGLVVSREGENDQWLRPGLAPAGYRARVAAGGRWWEKDFALDRGDLLLVRLLPGSGGKGVEFLRGLYSDRFPSNERAEANQWRLSLLENRLQPDRSAQFFPTLERLPDAREMTLRLLKPRFVWWELTPFGSSDPQRLVWHYAAGYPAPAWQLSVPKWPMVTGTSVPASSKLRVWWNGDQDPYPGAVLEQGPDYQSIRDLVRRSVPVGSSIAQIRSVAVEDRVVTTSPGKRGTQPCLVVRISHPPDQPLWAVPRGAVGLGVEHWFFTRTGQYTAVYWPVTPGEADRAITRLELFSLRRFQADAEQRGSVLSLDPLPAPSPASAKPLPPLGLE